MKMLWFWANDLFSGQIIHHRAGCGGRIKRIIYYTGYYMHLELLRGSIKISKEYRTFKGINECDGVHKRLNRDK
jgi:hypothetical protein